MTKPTFKRRIVGVVNQLVKPMGIELTRRKPSPSLPEKKKYFYEPHESCQIPNLGYLWEICFGRSRDGVFVEVGAYDGHTYSNTSCLADKGWTGFYLEPIPESAKRCRERHAANPKVTVEEFAIGAEEKEIEFLVGGPLSTSNAEVASAYTSISWASSAFAGQVKVKAKQVTLDSFLASAGVRPGFDLLVVDVEGNEAQVFRGFSLSKYMPRVIVVELSDTHPDFSALRESNVRILDDICGADYMVIHKDSINTVFVKRDLYVGR